MNQKLTALAALVAITALSVIRHNDERHVPGSKNETFGTDPETAERLVGSGAAKYAVDAADQAASDQAAAEQALADQAAAGPAGADQAAAAAKTAPAKTATKKR